MSYPILPTTLSALNSVLATPADNEVASAWPAVDRQTRAWVYGFLAQFFDTTTNQLKPAAIGGGTVPTGSVYGTNPVGSAQRQIVQGSIQGVDIATNAIATGNIALQAVTGPLLGLQSVDTAQLKDGAVTLAKLAGGLLNGATLAVGSVGTAQLAAGSVTTTILAAAAVTNPAIAPRAVDGSQLPQANVGQILVGGNTVNGQVSSLAPQTLSGAITIDAAGVTTLATSLVSALLSSARVVEFAPPGTACGPSNSTTAFGSGITSAQGFSAATPWNGRGLGQGATTALTSVAWVKDYDPANLLTIDGAVTTTTIAVGATNYDTYQRRIYVNQECILMIKVSIPGYKVGTHRCRLIAYPDANSPATFKTFWGTSANSGTGDTTQTTSDLLAICTFSAPAGSVLPYFYVDWFAGAAVALSGSASGMGTAAGLGGNEFYGDITVIRLA